MPGIIHATVAIIPARKKLVGVKPKRFEIGKLISICPMMAPIIVKTVTFKLNLSIFFNNKKIPKTTKPKKKEKIATFSSINRYSMTFAKIRIAEAIDPKSVNIKARSCSFHQLAHPKSNNLLKSEGPKREML